MPNSKALQEFSELHLRDEFKEVKPICFFAQDHGVIHANKPIETLDDLRGRRVRFSARLLFGDALRAVGVNAMSIPVPQVREARLRCVIDGCVLAWESVPTLEDPGTRQVSYRDSRLTDLEHSRQYVFATRRPGMVVSADGL